MLNLGLGLYLVELLTSMA